MRPAVATALRIEAAEPVSGGCIHRCFSVRIAGEARFLKLNSARFAEAFAAEADGLEALRAAGYRAPLPMAQGIAESDAFFLMEFLPLGAPQDFAALGRMLARAHRRQGSRFGWHRDNFIGSTPQQNGWCDDWAKFWTERRLGPQLALAERNGFGIDARNVGELLRGHRPQPSLLHGDLWSGNTGFTAEGPVVFDPAVYYGDREADLAMTELFGGFPRAFYETYETELPLQAGYEERKALYNLYHLLNHLNLFGASYLAQVEKTLRLLLRTL